MWVGLELPGVMIQLDVDKLSKKEQVDGEGYTLITKSDLVSVCIVNLAAAGVPGGWLKTRPHAFCFGAVDGATSTAPKQISSDYIWFTGKLTNTVGRECGSLTRSVGSTCRKRWHQPRQCQNYAQSHVRPPHTQGVSALLR